MISNPTSLRQPKPMNTEGKGKNAFRFQNFAERLEAVDIDVHRRTDGLHLHRDADERLGIHASLFAQRMRHWGALDLSTHFKAFKKEMAGKWASLPLILHHKEFIISTLLRHLVVSQSLAIASLLDLLSVLCKDLRSELAPFFQEIFKTCVELMDPKFPKLLELVFTCLSYLFKFLHKQLLADFLNVFQTSFWPLLAHKKVYIRKFAAESVSFLLRRIPEDSLESVADTLWGFCEQLVETQNVSRENLVDGMGQLWFQTFRNVRLQFHSNFPVVFAVLLRPHASEFRTESISACLSHALEHVHRDNSQQYWDMLLAQSRNYLDQPFGEVCLKYVEISVLHRRGGRIIQLNQVVEFLKETLSAGHSLSLFSSLVSVRPQFLHSDTESVMDLLFANGTLHIDELIPIVKTLSEQETLFEQFIISRVVTLVHSLLSEQHYEKSVELMELVHTNVSTPLTSIQELFTLVTLYSSDKVLLVSKALEVFSQTFLTAENKIMALLHTLDIDNQFPIFCSCIQILVQGKLMDQKELDGHISTLLQHLDGQHRLLSFQTISVSIQYRPNVSVPLDTMLKCISWRYPSVSVAACNITATLLSQTSSIGSELSEVLSAPLVLAEERVVIRKLIGIEKLVGELTDNVVREFVVRVGLALLNVRFSPRWKPACSLLAVCAKSFSGQFIKLFQEHLETFPTFIDEENVDPEDSPLIGTDSETVLLNLFQVVEDASLQKALGPILTKAFLKEGPRSSKPLKSLISILKPYASADKPPVIAKLRSLLSNHDKDIQKEALKALFLWDDSLVSIKPLQTPLESLCGCTPDTMLLFPVSSIAESDRFLVVPLITSLLSPGVLQALPRVLEFMGTFLLPEEHSDFIKGLTSSLDAGKGKTFLRVVSAMLKSCRGIVRSTLEEIMEAVAYIACEGLEGSMDNKKRDKNIVQSSLKVLAILLEAFPTYAWETLGGFRQLFSALEDRLRNISINVQEAGSLWKTLVVCASHETLTFIFNDRIWLSQSICECIPTASASVVTAILSIFQGLSTSSLFSPESLHSSVGHLCKGLQARYKAGFRVREEELDLLMALADHLQGQDTDSLVRVLLDHLVSPKHRLRVLQVLGKLSPLPETLMECGGKVAHLFAELSGRELCLLSEICKPGFHVDIGDFISDLTALTVSLDEEYDFSRRIDALRLLSSEFTLPLREWSTDSLIYLLSSGLWDNQLSIREGSLMALKHLLAEPNTPLDYFKWMMTKSMKGLGNPVDGVRRACADALSWIPQHCQELGEPLKGLESLLGPLTSFKVEERRKALVKVTRKVPVLNAQGLEMVVVPILMQELLPPEPTQSVPQAITDTLQRLLDNRQALLEDTLRALGAVSGAVKRKVFVTVLRTLVKARETEHLPRGWMKLLLRAVCVVLDHLPADFVLDSAIISKLEEWGAALAVVKVLDKQDKLDEGLGKVFRKLAMACKSKFQDERDVARKTMVEVAEYLGPRGVPSAMRELSHSLTEDYQLHVKSYVLHAVLEAACSEKGYEGDVKDVEQALEVFLESLVGMSGNSRTRDRPSKKMRELSSGRVLNSFALLGRIMNAESAQHFLCRFQQLLAIATSKSSMDLLGRALEKLSFGLLENTNCSAESLLSLASDSLQENEEAPAELVQESDDSTRWKTMEVRKLTHKTVQGLATDSVTSSAVTTAGRHLLSLQRINIFSLLLVLGVFRKHAQHLENKVELLDPLLVKLSALVRKPRILSQELLAHLLKAIGFLLRSETPLPSLEKLGRPLLEQMLFTAGSTASPQVSQACFQGVAGVIRHCDVTLEEPQLRMLLGVVEESLGDAGKLGVAFPLLGAILSRRWVLPELYDLMDKVLELVIHGHDQALRQHASKAGLRFILDYPMKEKRLLQSVRLFRNNLSFARPSGRLTALSMLDQLVRKLPSEAVELEALFVCYFQRVLNEEDSSVRERLLQSISVLVETMESAERNAVGKLLTAWCQAKPVIRRGVAYVLPIVLEFVPLHDKAVQFAEENAKEILARFEERIDQALPIDTEDSGFLYRLLVLWEDLLKTRSQSMGMFPDLLQICRYPHALVREHASRLVLRFLPQKLLDSSAILSIALDHLKDEWELSPSRIKVLVDMFVYLCSESEKALETLTVEGRRLEFVSKQVIVAQCLLKIVEGLREWSDDAAGFILDFGIRAVERQNASIRNSGEDRRPLVQLVQEMLEKLKETMGAERFLELYETSRQEIFQAKQDRKRKQKLQVVLDPEAAAREKKRKSVNKRDNRKRKLQERMAVRKGHAPEAARALVRRREK